MFLMVAFSGFSVFHSSFSGFGGPLVVFSVCLWFFIGFDSAYGDGSTVKAFKTETKKLLPSSPVVPQLPYQ